MEKAELKPTQPSLAGAWLSLAIQVHEKGLIVDQKFCSRDKLELVRFVFIFSFKLIPGDQNSNLSKTGFPLHERMIGHQTKVVVVKDPRKISPSFKREKVQYD